MHKVRKPISNLRWWIGGLLFASTVINYIDRQTLSLLAPYLKLQYHWTNSDYANLAIAFRVAYSIGQNVFGRLMDRVGTRRGLTITVICYSIISMLTSFARGFYFSAVKNQRRSLAYHLDDKTIRGFGKCLCQVV